MSLIDDLYGVLRDANKVAYFNANHTELSVRCPYCGDSMKDRTHAHLYINVNPPYSFYCQRCESSGILNDGSLEDIGVFDDELSLAFHKSIKKFKR